jgi:hypothetical protein
MFISAVNVAGALYFTAVLWYVLIYVLYHDICTLLLYLMSVLDVCSLPLYCF